MTILKNVWRFQCDPNGEDDPVVSIFLRKTVVVDGEEFVKDDMTPIQMKFSEMTGGLSDLVNETKVAAKADEIAAARLDALKPTPPVVSPDVLVAPTQPAITTPSS